MEINLSPYGSVIEFYKEHAKVELAETGHDQVISAQLLVPWEGIGRPRHVHLKTKHGKYYAKNSLVWFKDIFTLDTHEYARHRGGKFLKNVDSDAPQRGIIGANLHWSIALLDSPKNPYTNREAFWKVYQKAFQFVEIPVKGYFTIFDTRNWIVSMEENHARNS